MQLELIMTCMLNFFIVCEQARAEAKRRARSLEEEEAQSVNIPDCEPETGKFLPVQCSRNQVCYCVDPETGFEKSGTRANSVELVNCTSKQLRPKNFFTRRKIACFQIITHSFKIHLPPKSQCQNSACMHTNCAIRLMSQLVSYD